MSMNDASDNPVPANSTVKFETLLEITIIFSRELDIWLPLSPFIEFVQV